MKLKAVSGIMLTLLLIGMLILTFNIQPVEAPYPIIYIKADGSIDPSTANITSPDNVTYTFTADINASIVVEKDNIVVDGAGYTVQGAGSGTGIDLSDRSNVTLKNVEVTNFTAGISLAYSNNNNVTGSIASNNSYYGISLGFSSNNTVTGNIVSNNGDGIFLDSSSKNTVIGNTASSNNHDGILLYSSSNNIITGNIVSNNGDGIYLWSSSNNTLFHNNLISNTVQARVTTGYVDTWDDGVEGNYWSNYTGVDLDHDGIGDTPHVIDANNKDTYPLMGMFYDFTIFMPPYPSGGFEHVTVISNSTVSNLEVLIWLTSANEYLQPGQEFIRFDVTGEEGSIGFCRVMIPRVVLNGSYIVLVDWKEVPFTEIPSSNSTHAFLCFTYNHSTQEVIIIPEFPALLILSLFMITTLLAVITYRRKYSM